MKTYADASMQPEIVKLIGLGPLKNLWPVLLREDWIANEEACSDENREDDTIAFPLVSCLLFAKDLFDKLLFVQRLFNF